jgi:hypothetical protein
LIQSFTHCFAATHEIEILFGALKRSREPKDGANAPEANELQLFQVDRHGFGSSLKTLFDRRGEVVPIGCFHPTVGPGDQSLPLLQKLDLHNVLQAVVSAFMPHCSDRSERND